MKVLYLILFSLIMSSCHQSKTVMMADGTFITERQHKRILIKVYRETMREMSKEEKKVIKELKFETQ